MNLMLHNLRKNFYSCSDSNPLTDFLHNCIMFITRGWAEIQRDPVQLRWVPLDFKETTLISIHQNWNVQCISNLECYIPELMTSHFKFFSSLHPTSWLPSQHRHFLTKNLNRVFSRRNFCFKLIEGWTMEHNLFSALCFPLFPSVFLLLACQSPMCMQEGLVVSESIVSKHPY